MGRGKFLRSLRQRWWLLVLLVLPVTGGTLAYTLWSPTKYEGFMTLADRRDIDVNLPPLYQDQMLGRAVNEQEIRVLNLANTISSYTVLRSSFDELTSTGVLEMKGSRPAAELDFMNKIEVRPLRGTEYIQVSYASEERDNAKKVIDTILAKFRTRFANLNAEQSKARVKLVEEQLNEQRAIYHAKLQEQKEFQEAHKEGIAVESTTPGLVSMLNAAQDRYARAEGIEAAARETIFQAEKQAKDPLVAELQEKGLKQDALNPLHTELQTRINQSEGALASIKQRYGDKHPRVIELKESIKRDTELLKDTEAWLEARSTPDVPELEQNRRSAILEARRTLAAASAEKIQAQRQIGQLEAKRDRLPVVQKELTSMDSELLALSNSVSQFTAKLEEAKVRMRQNLDPTIYMLDDPMVRELPRGTVLKTLVALFLSLVVAVSLIASLGQFDQGTYTPIEAENSLGFPVIATLPRSHQQRLTTGVEQPTALAASYQILSTQIMSVKEKLIGPGILVAAAEPDVGRSTVAANLAISLARDGARVLLVDADLRAPVLHQHFGLENRAGLSEVLSGAATVENVVQPSAVDGLLFIAAGQPPVNPVRLFRSEAMDHFIELVSKGADYIVFDSPSGSTFGDAAVLAFNVQNVVLVHEAGRAPSVAEYEFHKSLERLGVNVIGMVLNKARADDCAAYQHFRRNYEATIGRYHPPLGPAALAAGGKPAREKPQQYGSAGAEDEE